MAECKAYGCTNNKRRNRGKHFFCVPKPTNHTKSELAKRWLHNLGTGHTLKTFPFGANSVVCEDHFTPSSYLRDLRAELLGTKSKRLCLKPDAVPTEFVHRSSRNDVRREERLVKRNKSKAVGCTNRRETAPGIGFFMIPNGRKYPSKRELAQTWLHNIGRGDSVGTFPFGKGRVLCERHFDPDCFEPDRMALMMGLESIRPKRLRADAVPTRFDHRKRQNTNTGRQRRAAKREQRQMIRTLLQTPAPSVTRRSKSGRCAEEDVKCPGEQPNVCHAACQTDPVLIYPCEARIIILDEETSVHFSKAADKKEISRDHSYHRTKQNIPPTTITATPLTPGSSDALPAGAQQLLVKDEVCSDWTSSPGLEVKQETPWEHPQGEQQLFENQEMDIFAVTVKSEEEEKPQVSELHWRQTEDNIKEERPVSIKEEPSTCSSAEERQTGSEGDHREGADVIGFDSKLKTGDRTKEKPFSWDACGERFHRKHEVKSHKTMHTAEKSYVCDVCGKHFLRLWDVERHKFVHRGEKPFGCDERNKYFKRQCDNSQITR